MNALLPGGTSRTGMIPEDLPEELKAGLLDPTIMVPPLLGLASEASGGMTGKRINASPWRFDMSEAAAATLAAEDTYVG